MARLHKNIVEALFYSAKDQLLDVASVKSCVEDFLFDQMRTEDSLDMSSLRRSIANSIATAVSAGLDELHGRIRRATDESKRDELVDRQIFVIAEVVTNHFLAARFKAESELLKKMLESD